jgi:riboflavin biosynthesis pyrimidine reductase
LGVVRQLLPPSPGDVDPVAVVASEARPAPRHRPWLLMNMIASVDGATRVAGRSGGLGGPADVAMFHALRGIADLILVGTATVAAETYHPPSATPEVRAARSARGQDPLPRLAIVTASLRIEPTAEVFADPWSRPIVLTTTDADPDRVAALAPVADVVTAGEGTVDLAGALGALRSTAACVLCEGGPTLNGSLLDAGVVDELCLTVAPLVLSGEPSPIIKGATSALRTVRLDRILEADGLLFLRYLWG